MSETIDTRALPAVITTYLTVDQARDLDPALACYTDDAVVTDEGRTHRGKHEIRNWLNRAASRYTYTTTLVAAHHVDNEHYVAVHHLQGDFPGGVVDLRLQFTLDGDRIAELVIEP
ncbi:nuclear transport factor 2 family protein [Amycolatopsis sp. NPDC051903]|uniref:nuclear transport factor 2 family protein n=1 Tax=Amycolatopsis sp. NPDC051903 TaxID=3363936 RepID=UPI0037A08282